MPKPLQGDWVNLQNVSPKQYSCGYCDSIVASVSGWLFKTGGSHATAGIYICPYCKRPTFFEEDSQQPGISFGSKVNHISPDVDSLYQEARKCTKAGAQTAAVLACRKILMHTAVDKGAPPGKSFVEYVEYLSEKGYITPGARAWVDAIRTKGNEANHEIKVMAERDAQDLLALVEMLLKIIYEFPGRVPKLTSGTATPP